MSQRGKRGNRLDNENNAHQQTQQPPSKRRKGRPPTSSNGEPDQEMSTGATTIPVVSAGVQPNLSSAASSSSSTMWQARPITGPQIYNRNSSEAPAELFRKDLISAMKLPDSEPLSTDEYWVIVDQWKQEWERGVQVPVNPDSLPEPSVKQLSSPIAITRHDFKLPKNKYLRITKDEHFSSEQHFLSNAPVLADSACSYDLDQVDETWLQLVNNERALCGTPAITEGQFERVVEELEVRCWERIQAIMRNEEGLGIEYDENVICDVCRSPDSEEANEMVFCDNCNICVHQACYGITVIPSGQWLCRTCSMGKKPDCALCPNKGGAMKSTRSGKKWAHVSCALWIPEVSIGCVDKMEPITKISSIPQTRWSLLCILCRERVGACIQCSVSTCKTAYHVTCAFQHGLEMRAIIEEGNAEDGVKLRSYCLKHCNAKGKKEKGTNNNGSGSDDDCRRRKIRTDMTSEERNQARLMRSKEVEAEFDKHVNVKDISCHLLDVDQEAITSIYNYWILKRKSACNRPLIPPKVDDADMVPNRQDQADIEKKIMFVHLRQDLERVRNLCYMVNRREKLSRTFFKMREQIFHKQIAILSDHTSGKYDESVIHAIIHANNGSSVYDKCYSSSSLGSPAINVEDLQERILGAQQMLDLSSSIASAHSTKFDDKSKNNANSSSRNSYKKIHLNGISDRKAVDSVYEDSSLSSNSEAAEKYHLKPDASSVASKKKAQSYSKILENHKRRKSLASSIAVDSSSDEEELRRERSGPKKNPSLHQMEKELAKDADQMLTSSDDSDLLEIRQMNNQLLSKKSQKPIYSDSDSTDKERTDNTVSDSQQQMFRTKAAMKEFSLQQAASKYKQEIVLKKAPAPVKATKQVHGAANKTKAPLENSRNNERASKTKPKTRVQVESDTEEKEDKKDTSRKKQKPNDIDSSQKVVAKESNSKKFPSDLLVVPQRQAAKKASENMRSTNSYVNLVGQKKDGRDGRMEEKEIEVAVAKNKDKWKEKDKELKDDDKDKEREKEKEREKDKERGKPRGRPPKQVRDESKEKHIVEKEKESTVKEKEKSRLESQQQQKTSTELQQKNEKALHKGLEKSDSQLMVAYVPQRQAAKKAAEHIKSGMGKSNTAEMPLEEREKDMLREREKTEKDKTEKDKDKDNKPKSESEKNEKSDKDKAKLRDAKCDSIDQIFDKSKQSEKEEKNVNAAKTGNLEVQRAERRSRGSTSVEDAQDKHESKPPQNRRRSTHRIDLTSTSSESSSSSSCSSSSSESEDENETLSVGNKRSLTDDREMKPVSPPEHSIEPKKMTCEHENFPLTPDDTKNSGNMTQISTPKTIDSDVLCIDDSPETNEKKSNTPVDMEIARISHGDDKELVTELEDKQLIEMAIRSKNTVKSPFEQTECSVEKPPSLENYAMAKIFHIQNLEDERSSEKENTQKLEKEMAQRKADLTCFQLGGFKNNSHNSSGSLDKLLNKLEREREEQEDDEKGSDSMEIDDTIKMHDDHEMKTRIPSDEDTYSRHKLPLKSKHENSNENITAVIDIDSESGESNRGKMESEHAGCKGMGAAKSGKSSPEITLSLASFLPADIGKDLTARNDALQQKHKSPGPYEDHIERDLPVKKTPVKDTSNKSKVVCEFPTEPIFEAKPSEEDSARATMNLVEKLRQKYKRSSSKPDDAVVPSVEGRDESKSSNSGIYKYHSDVFAAEAQSTHDLKYPAECLPVNKEKSVFDNDMTSKEDATVLKESSVFEQHTSKTDSAISFFEKSRILSESDPNSTLTKGTLNELKNNSFGVASAADPITDLDKRSPIFAPPKSVDKTQTNTKKSTDSFDSLTQSNFFKVDFVDMRSEKDTLDVDINASKVVVDCEYDDNTRMQSPYINPVNIWNENNLIQTRRSVSSSPSSISESNDEMPRAPAGVNEMSAVKVNEDALQHHHAVKEQHQPHQHTPVSMACNAENRVEKNNFNIISPFASISQPQFAMQTHITHQQGIASGMTSLQQQHHQLPQHTQHQQSQGSLAFMNGADVMPYNYAENSHYNGPVSVFSSQPLPPNLNTQMPPFPSMSTQIFPQSLGAPMPLSQNTQSTSGSIFSLVEKQKHSDATLPYPLLRQPCAATFTSSTDNLALTQELISNNVANVPLSTSQIINSGYSMSTAVDSVMRNNTAEAANSLNHMMNCEAISNNNVNAKDSPSKRSSARFNQIKSPSLHKSPGKSPRNMDLVSRQQSQSNNQKGKYEASQRSKSKSARGSGSGRARGRGRGRGRMVAGIPTAQHLDFDSSLGTLPNNLAGTVYDWTEEDLSTSVDLKSLRDRRRSFDSRGNTVGSCEQKFTSPGYPGKLRNAMMSSKPATDVKSPHMGSNESDLHASHSYLSNIHPVLPGPVDMRTYNPGYENQSAANQEAYNNHLLGAFAIGMADQTLNEIDEEDEKKLQSDLKASGTYKSKTPIADIVVPESHVSIETTSEEISIDSDNTISKVSLSDSRNQLKLKIKGPLARPDNYNSQASGGSLAQNLNSNNLGLQMSSASNVTLTSSSNTTGTSSLRRMRKKELLRQYWTQDMNMDDGASHAPTENKAINEPILSRSVGIPKAVDSMSSIPTKEDYKDYASMDPRKRKRSQGLSRELRQLDLPYESDRPERRRSVCSSSSNISVNNVVDPMKVSLKRRNKAKLDSPNSSEAPKLKIKIGNHIATISDGNRMIGCPPKKRPTSKPPVPTLEILKRDCMNFRKQMMADFDDEEGAKAKKLKIKPKKNSKTSSHKKKKKEKRDYAQIVENTPGAEAPKLIIRFGGGSAAGINTVVVDPTTAMRSSIDETPESSIVANPEQTGSPSLMPIKLKIARNSDGGGYVIGGSKRLGPADTKSIAQQQPERTEEGDTAPHYNNKKEFDRSSGCNYGADRMCTEQVNSPMESDGLVTLMNASLAGDDPASALAANNSENTSTMNVQILAPNKANSDLKGGQAKASKGCPLLPINKDCEVR